MHTTKYAAHLLRLYRMGIEILREQEVRVRRPDAAWLRVVLGGRYSHDELMALVAELRRELAEAEAASSLPAEPDVVAVEALVVDLQRRALGIHGSIWSMKDRSCSSTLIGSPTRARSIPSDGTGQGTWHVKLLAKYRICKKRSAL